MPVTFYVEMPNVEKESAYNQAMLPFINYFQTLQQGKEALKEFQQQISQINQNDFSGETSPTGDKKGKNASFSMMKESTMFKPSGKEKKQKPFNFEKRTYTKLSCPLSHFDGHNLWLLKPTHLNRGRGIHVFNDLNTLHKLIKEYCSGKDEESWKKKTKKFMPQKDEDETPEKADKVEKPEK